jgi:hypothetical protein
VRIAASPLSCGISTTPRDTACSRPVTGSPSISTRPATGRSNPAIAHNSVVFPAPDGPVTASNSPGRTVTVTSRSTGSPVP